MPVRLEYLQYLGRGKMDETLDPKLSRILPGSVPPDPFQRALQQISSGSCQLGTSRVALTWTNV